MGAAWGQVANDAPRTWPEVGKGVLRIDAALNGVALHGTKTVLAGLLASARQMKGAASTASTALAAMQQQAAQVQRQMSGGAASDVMNRSRKATITAVAHISILARQHLNTCTDSATKVGSGSP